MPGGSNLSDGSSDLRPRGRTGALIAVTVLLAILTTAAIAGGSGGAGRPAPAASPGTDGSATPSPEVTETPTTQPPVTQGPLPTPPPPLHFQIRSVDSIRTDADLGPRKTARATRRGVQAVRSVVTKLYHRGFLSLRTWPDGRYAEVFDLFEPGAPRAAARGALGVLTLGRDAGARFARVRQLGAFLRVRVLIGRYGGPFTATASVVFRAHATRFDDSRLTIVSEGRYFLRPGDGGWRIFGFTVKRLDHQATS